MVQHLNLDSGRELLVRQCQRASCSASSAAALGSRRREVRAGPQISTSFARPVKVQGTVQAIVWRWSRLILDLCSRCSCSFTHTSRGSSGLGPRGRYCSGPASTRPQITAPRCRLHICWLHWTRFCIVSALRGVWSFRFKLTEFQAQRGRTGLGDLRT